MTTAKYAALMILLGFIVGCEGRQTEAPPELHQAAKTGDVEKCTALLAAGADVNAKDRAGRTALHEAVESRHVDVVKLLLAHGANVNAISDSGETVMGRAISWQDIDCVTLLADNGADLNMKDGDGFPPLQRQVLLGEVMGQSGLGPIGRILIEKGADIHARDPLGQTPLECAIAAGALDEVEFLLAKGADVNEEGSYALAIAAEHEHQDVFDLLLAKGARIHPADTRGNRNLFLFAVHHGFTGFLEKLSASVDMKELVNSKDDASSNTLLHDAAEAGDRHLADLLIAYGAAVNATNTSGTTPLHCAVSTHHVDIVFLLTSQGADVNARDVYGRTPLHGAASKGYRDIVEHLLAHGASKSIQDGRGLAPLDAAVKGQHDTVAEVLR